jgi:DNA repair photolyase
MVAPIIPGLNDSEIPGILAAAASAGAQGAGYVLLRLPFAVAPIFMAWIDEHRPTAKRRIENAIRSTRAGALNSSAFGERMKGKGLLAEQVEKLFHSFAKRLGLDHRLPPTACDLFRPPGLTPGQNWLF